MLIFRPLPKGHHQELLLHQDLQTNVAKTPIIISNKILNE